MTSLILLCSSLLVLGQASPTANTLPQEPTKYVVEVYFVVEPQVVRNYINLGYDSQTAVTTLRQDIEFLIYEVNKYFQSMEEHGLYMEIRKKRLDILNSEMFSPYQLQRGSDIKGHVALDAFKGWLNQTGAYQAIDYDVALLWTGYNALSRSGSPTITGYATSKSACYSYKSAAIVEFDGTQSTAHTTSHELAHTLGTSHDTSFSCPPFVGYVMASALKAENANRWGFSVCSTESIKEYMDKLDRKGKNCLLVSNSSPAHFDVASQNGRDIMNVQKMCARKRRDKDSYFCGFESFYHGSTPQGDLVCKYLYCGHYQSRSCKTAVPTEGMVCDVGKRCNRGRCVTAPVSNPVREHVRPGCVFGDVLSGSMFGFKGTCDEYLRTEGLERCYRYNVQIQCCETCAARQIPIQGCEFGDRYKECGQYTPQQICPNNRKECCFTCREFRQKRSASNDTVALPPLSLQGEDDNDDEDFEE